MNSESKRFTGRSTYACFDSERNNQSISKSNVYINMNTDEVERTNSTIYKGSTRLRAQAVAPNMSS